MPAVMQPPRALTRAKTARLPLPTRRNGGSPWTGADATAGDVVTDPAMTVMTTTSIPGVLLAGGLAQPTGGGDKPIRMLDGRTVLTCVVARLAPQCSGLVLSAEGDPARSASRGPTVMPEGSAGFPGPLAGILAGGWPVLPLDPFFNANTAASPRRNGSPRLMTEDA